LTKLGFVWQYLPAKIEFTQASRRHKIGRRTYDTMATTQPTAITTNCGAEGWLYIGPDERGRVLEIIAVITEADALLVVHVMPHHFREGS
jgi:hypothetical protein